MEGEDKPPVTCDIKGCYIAAVECTAAPELVLTVDVTVALECVLTVAVFDTADGGVPLTILLLGTTDGEVPLPCGEAVTAPGTRGLGELLTDWKGVGNDKMLFWNCLIAKFDLLFAWSDLMTRASTRSSRIEFSKLSTWSLPWRKSLISSLVAMEVSINTVSILSRTTFNLAELRLKAFRKGAAYRSISMLLLAEQCIQKSSDCLSIFNRGLLKVIWVLLVYKVTVLQMGQVKFVINNF